MEVTNGAGGGTTGADLNTFNTANLATVIRNLDTQIGTVKQQFESAYTTFAGKLRENWNGKDEEAFEGVVINDLNEIFENCYNLKEDTNYYMTEAVRTYEIFQDRNKAMLTSSVQAAMNAGAINESDISGQATTTEYTKIPLGDGAKPTFTPSGARTYEEGASMGLLNDNSGNAMMTAAEQFKTDVKGAIDGFRNVQDQSQIFHSTQATEEDLGIKKLLDVVANSMVVFVHHIQNFMDDYIPKLVQAYKDQSNATQASTSGGGETTSAADTIQTNVTNTFGEDAYAAAGAISK